MTHNSVSNAAHARSQREWSESTKGLVSIRGSLCPCNGAEFWFYLIGGSHPLFRNAGAKKKKNGVRLSIIPGEARQTLLLLLLLFSPVPSLLAIVFLVPPARSLILLSIRVLVWARTRFGRRRTGGDTVVHATQGLRGAKRKLSVAVGQE